MVIIGQDPYFGPKQAHGTFRLILQTPFISSRSFPARVADWGLPTWRQSSLLQHLIEGFSRPLFLCSQRDPRSTVIGQCKHRLIHSIIFVAKPPSNPLTTVGPSTGRPLNRLRSAMRQHSCVVPTDIRRDQIRVSGIRDPQTRVRRRTLPAVGHAFVAPSLTQRQCQKPDRVGEKWCPHA